MGTETIHFGSIFIHVVVWLLLFSCVFAAILEYACMKDSKIPDNALSLVGRRILIAGLLINASRLALSIYDGNIPFQILGITSQLMIVFSCIIRCMNRLWVIDKITHSTVVDFDKTGFFKVNK